MYNTKEALCLPYTVKHLAVSDAVMPPFYILWLCVGSSFKVVRVMPVHRVSA